MACSDHYEAKSVIRVEEGRRSWQEAPVDLQQTPLRPCPHVVQDPDALSNCPVAVACSLFQVNHPPYPSDHVLVVLSVIVADICISRFARTL